MDSCMLFLVYLFISGTTLSLISFKQEKEKEELFCTLCNSRRIIVQLVTTCFLCSAMQSESYVRTIPLVFYPLEQIAWNAFLFECTFWNISHAVVMATQSNVNAERVILRI